MSFFGVVCAVLAVCAVTMAQERPVVIIQSTSCGVETLSTAVQLYSSAPCVPIPSGSRSVTCGTVVGKFTEQVFESDMCVGEPVFSSTNPLGEKGDHTSCTPSDFVSAECGDMMTICRNVEFYAADSMEHMVTRRVYPAGTCGGPPMEVHAYRSGGCVPDGEFFKMYRCDGLGGVLIDTYTDSACQEITTSSFANEDACVPSETDDLQVHEFMCSCDGFNFMPRADGPDGSSSYSSDSGSASHSSDSGSASHSSDSGSSSSSSNWDSSTSGSTDGDATCSDTIPTVVFQNGKFYTANSMMADSSGPGADTIRVGTMTYWSMHRDFTQHMRPRYDC